MRPRQRAKEPACVHVVLECLAPIDEDHRNLIVILLTQLTIGIDIDLAPFKVGFATELRERLLDHVAKMASLPRIHQNFMHRKIVSVPVTMANRSTAFGFEFAAGSHGSRSCADDLHI